MQDLFLLNDKHSTSPGCLVGMGKQNMGRYFHMVETTGWLGWVPVCDIENKLESVQRPQYLPFPCTKYKAISEHQGRQSMYPLCLSG